MATRSTQRKKTPTRKTSTKKKVSAKKATTRSVGSVPTTSTAQFSDFLSRFPPKTIALAKQCLSKLGRALPGTNLVVYEYADSLVVSFSQSEHGYEGIVTLKVLPQEVRLFFDKSIPDPKRLLQGSGGKVRSAIVTAASQLDRGDIHDFIKAAIKHSGVTLPRSGSNRVIIKSALTKKSPRKR